MFCKSSESNLRGLPAPGLLFWTALWSLALLVAKLQVTQPQKTLNMRWLSLLFLGFELVASARAAFAADYQESAASHLTRLRHDLLTGAASLRNETYDPKVAPTGRSADYSAAGTDVSMLSQRVGTVVTRNFVLGTYATQEAIDADDGSSYFHAHHNFFAYAIKYGNEPRPSSSSRTPCRPKANRHVGPDWARAFAEASGSATAETILRKPIFGSTSTFPSTRGASTCSRCENFTLLNSPTQPKHRDTAKFRPAIVQVRGRTSSSPSPRVPIQRTSRG